jgi:hypothetical protein
MMGKLSIMDRNLSVCPEGLRKTARNLRIAGIVAEI